MYENIKIKIERNERLTKEELIVIHHTLTSKEICEGLPKEFTTIYELIKKLKYKDKPDYSKIKMLFKEAENRLIKEKGNILGSFEEFNGYSIEYKFYWEKVFLHYMFKRNVNELIYDENKMKEIIQKYCLNFEKYIERILKNNEPI